MQIFPSYERLVGQTPMMQLTRFQAAVQGAATILAKLEFFNPAGSVKDRVALHMVTQAEAQGQLLPGSVIIEPTSGNTGIGLAAVAAARGYRLLLTMPETMSLERRKLLQAYGAELVLTPGHAGMQGAIEKAKALHAQHPGSFLPSQFTNPANPEAHYQTTGPEIWRDTAGQIDLFLAAVGTGGTITGVGQYLREQNPAVEIIAVEPQDSPVLSGGKPGPHELQGIGAGFVPDVLNVGIYDAVMAITSEEAFSAARALVATEGILAGISSGAVLAAAAKLSRLPAYRGKTLVTLLPDGGERYLSTRLFDAATESA